MRERGAGGGRGASRDWGERGPHGGRGGWGDRDGRGGRRGSRGDVRAAVLALLAERSMHGYEMLAELAGRSGEVWRPSPGSLYPALHQLEGEGLVRSAAERGRRRFELTADGRAFQARHAGGAPPWETIVTDADAGPLALRGALRDLESAVGQVATAGTPDQQAAACALLAGLRRRLYLLLAGPDGPVAIEEDR
jgi:DNA-binding PadR family transcriptional regulator